MNSLLRLLVFRAYPALIPWVLLPVSDSLRLGFVDLVFFPTLLIFLLSPSSKVSLISVSVLLFLMAVLLSVFQIPGNGDKVASILRCGRLGAIFLPLIVASSLRVTREDLASFLRIFFFSAAAAVAFGLIIHFMGWELVKTQQQIQVGKETVGRVSGLFGNTGTFGHLLALFLGLGVFGAPFWSRGYRCLAVQGFAVVLGVSGLVYASSRGGLLNFLIFACLYLFLSRGVLHGVQRVAAGAATLALLVAIILVADLRLPGLSNDTLLGSSLERFIPSAGQASEQFASGRMERWPKVIESSRDQALTGIGYKNSIKTFGHPVDNFFLSTFVELGILGLLTYCLFVAVVIMALARGYAMDPGLGALGLALFLATVLHGMTTDIWTHWATAPIATAAVGVIYARQRTLAERRRQRIPADHHPAPSPQAPGVADFGPSRPGRV